MQNKYVDFSVLEGVTLSKIEGNINSEILTFTVDENRYFTMQHYQDCCESVIIDEIHGDLEDLIGTEILFAEETFEHSVDEEGWGESSTWTFYKLATIKGHVTIKWHGSSNGYYSESVSFEEYYDQEAAYILEQSKLLAENPPEHFGEL